MKLAYSLNNNINIQKIVQDIYKLLQQYPKEQYENTVLTISLQKIVTSTDVPLLPTIDSSGSLSQPN